ncbi:uncharacterized protein LOC130614152 [Hydractinia symbiolongicarpus]|uniref:uncharacterized protein LOC130614152 n=1 Tax=Hydractinia symbiolongicarpus TaxID=13093 RepID=UPI00254D48B4|nr:uncharacterized protein LOC130614152 [Hydractinia symbiolongicarpus]
MRLLLIWYLLFVKCKVDGHANTSVVKLTNNVTISTRWASFKKHANFMSDDLIWKGVVQRALECASKCLERLICTGFHILNKVQSNLNCGLVNGTLITKHYYVRSDRWYDFYEMKNMCTLNPFICEHGSVCIPNFENNTYHCEWCFPPYYGKHCNLTGMCYRNISTY